MTTTTTTKNNKEQVLQNVINEFKTYGFIDSPKEPNNKYFLYKPSKDYGKEQEGILIHINSITDKNVYISVYDMIDNGINFGQKYHKFANTINGTTIKWDYTKRSFGRFYMTTYINRIQKLIYRK
jgi:hypothetical protein